MARERTAFLFIDLEDQYEQTSLVIAGLTVPFSQALTAKKQHVIHTGHHTDESPKIHVGSICTAAQYEQAARNRNAPPLKNIFRFVSPDPSHRVLMKPDFSAFDDTNLALYLRENGFNHVTILGVVAELDAFNLSYPERETRPYCIDATIVGALRRGFGVTLVRDLIWPTPDMQYTADLRARYPMVRIAYSNAIIPELKPLDHHQAQEIIVGPQVDEDKLEPAVG